MRIEPAVCLATALIAIPIGLAVGHASVLAGVAPTRIGEAAGLAVAVVLSACILTGYHSMNPELVKQIAVWLGIVTLLPLTVWYGTSAFSPPPEWERYSKSASRLTERIQETKDDADKEKLRQEKDQLDREREEAERLFYSRMFWVAYPIGMVAFAVGTFYPVQAVGAGLMFGGLSSLTAGCYSYWDKMGGPMRFGSLVVALVLVIALGTWKFRPGRPGGTLPL